MSRDFGILPIPRRLQHAEGQSRHLGLAANLMFGLAAAFTGLLHYDPVSHCALTELSQRPMFTIANPY
jgi:hypothetical protein